MTLLDQYNILFQQAKPSDKWPGRTVTDKGFVHCFIQEYYNSRFTPLKDKPIKLLELGVEYGYSMNLWLSWFTNATFVGIDPFQPATINQFNTLPNCKGINADGYIEETVNMFEDEAFDFIIEDGPHTLESQQFAAIYWTKKLKPGGLLIMEDVYPLYIDLIVEGIRTVKNIKVVAYDFTSKTGRHDDVILEFIKK